MTTIFIATPHTRPFEPEYVMSLYETCFEGHLLWHPLANKPVDDARNILAARFLQHPAKPDYLLFVDSDAVWHKEALTRLVERDLPVLTGGIYQRKLPPLPTMGIYTGRNPSGHYVYEFATTLKRIRAFAEERGLEGNIQNALCLEKGDEAADLWEVDGAGMHFCLIRRDAFRHLSMPYFRSPSLGGGEDFYFCRKLKEAGVPIYLDLTVQTGHLAGPGADFGLRELLSYFRWVKDPEDISSQEDLWEV